MNKNNCRFHHVLSISQRDRLVSWTPSLRLCRDVDERGVAERRAGRARSPSAARAANLQDAVVVACVVDRLWCAGRPMDDGAVGESELTHVPGAAHPIVHEFTLVQ